MSRQGQRTELGSEAVAGMWRSSGLDMAALPEGWVRLSVSARRSVGQVDAYSYSYYLDAELQARLFTRVLTGEVVPPSLEEQREEATAS